MGSKGIIKVAYILAEASWYWAGGFLSSEHRKLDQIGISGEGVSGVEMGRVFGDNTRRLWERESGTLVHKRRHGEKNNGKSEKGH